jgi:hypothetical protein
VQMTIGQSSRARRRLSAQVFWSKSPAGRPSCVDRQNVGIMRKIAIRLLRFEGVLGTLNTSGIDVFGNSSRFGWNFGR